VAEPRFQLRVVRRRAWGPDDHVAGRVTDSRPNGRDDLLVWRLLGGNNRELGRSGDQYATVTDCLQSIQAIKRLFESVAAPRVSFSSVRQVGSNWWWSVEEGGRTVAASARAFSRQLECRSNYDHFAAAVMLAAMPDPWSPTQPFATASLRRPR
jgi:hypothetical protein